AGALAAFSAEGADGDTSDDPAPAALPELAAAALPAGDADGLLARVAAAAAPDVERSPAGPGGALGGRLGRDAAGALAADRRESTELAGVSYRLWMSRGRADFGLGLGALGRVVPTPPAADAFAARPGLADAAPVVSVAMRYRVSERSAVFAD